MLTLLLGVAIFFTLVFLPMIPDSPRESDPPRSSGWFVLALAISLLLYYFLYMLLT